MNPNSLDKSMSDTHRNLVLVLVPVAMIKYKAKTNLSRIGSFSFLMQVPVHAREIKPLGA